MIEFKEYELESVCDRLSSGKNIKAAEVFATGTYPVYGGNGLRGYTEKENFSGDCAIIGRQGAYCGNVRYFSGTAYMTEHAVVVQANKDHNTRYLAYLLSKMNLGRLSGQSAQPGLSVKVLGKQMVSLPDKETQDKIADILAVLEDKIANNESINRNLSEQAQAYFDELFVQNLSPEWQEGTLSDIGTIVAGGTPSKAKDEYYAEEGIAWITPKDLSVDKSVFISHGENDISDLGYEKSSATKMPAGTVLFSSRAPIGYIAIAANEVTTNQGFKSVVPNKNVGTAYVYFLLKQLLPTIENMASGSTFKEISGSAMKIVPTVIPDDDTLRKFNEFCTPMLQQIQKNELESKRLAELRDGLLPKLMSGELDVSNLTI